VDFGTPVRDLSWSPDGRKAAFIDGEGDLAVSNPDGSGRVVAARNPGGQNWSHPTWLVRPADHSTGYPAASELIFSARSGSTSRLVHVATSAHGATPTPLQLNHESGEGVAALPQTGNVWPSGAGIHGMSVYANQNTGDVYIRDDYLRQQGAALTAGSEPALSTGGADQDIVFVRSVGGHDHLFVEHSTDNGPTYKDITPHAVTDYTEPAWSPDGRTIAARTVQGVVTLPADGSHAPVLTSGYHGLPAYRAS
jgi:Tol biopolymer transport system component